MKPLLVSGLFLLAVAGCAGPRQAQVLHPEFAARSVQSVALAPVVFADEPIDRYLGDRAAAEIRRQAAQALERKGYRVRLVGEGGGFAGPPMVPAGSDMARLTPAIAPDSDAVVQIRIDHFLDAGLYDGRSRLPLDIYATAIMIGAGREVLWQDSGRGEGLRQFFVPVADEVIVPADRLAASLFATLPPAR